MLRVGITGGIGSGKSVVSKIFEVYHYPVFYSDLEAGNILQSPELTDGLKSSFGSSVIDQYGKVARSYLANKVFSDSKALEALNQLIHPRVERAFEHWCAQWKVRGADVVFKESALIFELGLQNSLDYVILVKSPIEDRFERIMNRNPLWSRTEIENRMKNQWLDEAKTPLASFVINNGKNEELLPQIQEALQRILLG